MRPFPSTDRFQNTAPAGPALLLTLVVLFSAIPASAQTEKAEPDTASLQRQYVQQVAAQIDSFVQTMSPDLTQSDPFFASRSALNPDGRKAALALSREQGGENRWSVLILDKATLDVTEVYDFIRAHDLNKLEWSPDGEQLLLLAEDINLSGPPGSLSVIDSRSKRAYVIDRGVWQYVLSPDARSLVYERCEDPSNPLGKRQIFHARFDRLIQLLRDPALAVHASPRRQAETMRTQTIRQLKSLDYPREQLEGFKSWSADGSTLHAAIYRYGPGSTKPARVRYALDLAKGEARAIH